MARILFLISHYRTLSVVPCVTEQALVGFLLYVGACSVLSRVRLFAAPWAVPRQAPLSMGSCRQECWRGVPFPSPGDLPDPGIEPGSPALEADALTSEPPGKPQ